MDKKTGEPILVDEKPVISETEFTAKKSSGSVKVTFTFDATSLKGKTTVVFEELYQDEMQLAVHTDINDEDQTIYFQEIKTTAKDADTNSNISCAKEEITLVDTVSFKGLVPNQKYEVTGTLIDKETKKPVEAKASFKPKESAGTVDVTFTFDASSLKGKTVVVFESLAYKDKEVAVHTDIADEGQTIYFPEIKTTATDAASGTHYAKPEKEGIYNILIMEEKQSILALGAGASTKFVMNDRIERAENVKDIKNYIERIDEMIERKKQGYCDYEKNRV